MGGGPASVAAFLDRHAARLLDRTARARALELLDMERDVLRTRTSCAWFFDDVARLEPLQNLLYAAHALDLAGHGASMLEVELVTRLDHARSNDPKEGSAADMWRRQVRGPSARAPEAEEDDADEVEPTQKAPLAVARVLAEPWEGSLDAALEEIEAAPESVRHRA